ncbi:MAG: hypothetical protein KGS44_04555 [Alphaproteobacteria bacterium]|nr:hypothetical protein [Alphaproteobacteria bacterium]
MGAAFGDDNREAGTPRNAGCAFRGAVLQGRDSFAGAKGAAGGRMCALQKQKSAIKILFLLFYSSTGDRLTAKKRPKSLAVAALQRV